VGFTIIFSISFSSVESQQSYFEIEIGKCWSQSTKNNILNKVKILTVDKVNGLTFVKHETQTKILLQI